MKLLVVDDNLEQRARIVAAAQEAGLHDITEAADLEAGATEIATGDFDMAVFDMELVPKSRREDGLILVEKLRNKNPESCIVVVTAMFDDKAGVRALHAGADDFITSQLLGVNWDILLENRLRMWAEFTAGRISRKRSRLAEATT